MESESLATNQASDKVEEVKGVDFVKTVEDKRSCPVTESQEKEAMERQMDTNLVSSEMSGTESSGNVDNATSVEKNNEEHGGHSGSEALVAVEKVVDAITSPAKDREKEEVERPKEGNPLSSEACANATESNGKINDEMCEMEPIEVENSKEGKDCSPQVSIATIGIDEDNPTALPKSLGEEVKIPKEIESDACERALPESDGMTHDNKNETTATEEGDVEVPNVTESVSSETIAPESDCKNDMLPVEENKEKEERGKDSCCDVSSGTRENEEESSLPPRIGEKEEFESPTSEVQKVEEMEEEVEMPKAIELVSFEVADTESDGKMPVINDEATPAEEVKKEEDAKVSSSESLIEEGLKEKNCFVSTGPESAAEVEKRIETPPVDFPEPSNGKTNELGDHLDPIQEAEVEVRKEPDVSESANEVTKDPALKFTHVIQPDEKLTPSSVEVLASDDMVANDEKCQMPDMVNAKEVTNDETIACNEVSDSTKEEELMENSKLQGSEDKVPESMTSKYPDIIGAKVNEVGDVSERSVPDFVVDGTRDEVKEVESEGTSEDILEKKVETDVNKEMSADHNAICGVEGINEQASETSPKEFFLKESGGISEIMGKDAEAVVDKDTPDTDTHCSLEETKEQASDPIEELVKEHGGTSENIFEKESDIVADKDLSDPNGNCAVAETMKELGGTTPIEELAEERGRLSENISEKEDETVVNKDTFHPSVDCSVEEAKEQANDTFEDMVKENGRTSEFISEKESEAVVSEDMSDPNADCSVEDPREQVIGTTPNVDLVKEETENQVPDVSSAVSVIKAVDTAPVTEMVEELVKPEEKLAEDKVETVARDMPPSIEALKVKEMIVSDTPPQVTQIPSAPNESIETTPKFDGERSGEVKDGMMKLPETSNVVYNMDMVDVKNESETEVQVKQEESMKGDCDSMDKEEEKEAAIDPNIELEVPKKDHPVKSHSSNIISKVKHSIGKVKKKILGKHPSS